MPAAPRALVVALLALVPLSAPALAYGRDTGPWATVNVCEARTVGVRARMPGLEQRAQLEYRVDLQHQDAGGSWRLVQREPWRRLATQRRGYAEGGRSFTLDRAALLRGRVSFRWRRAGRTVRTAARTTSAGRHPAIGASSATCQLR